jgi:hypothetical protein
VLISSAEDILRARLKTLGISEYRFKFQTSASPAPAARPALTPAAKNTR